MPVKLYSVSDSPPSMAVKMTLVALNVPHEVINIDFMKGEHRTDEYAQKNPQKEVPVLEDDGFFLSESVAMMQYICDKYAPDNQLYPKDPQKRALVNHRLVFNISTLYKFLIEYTFGPVFVGYPRTEEHKKKAENALSVFETYQKRLGTKYAAGDNLTIADLSLVTGIFCLEAIDFDISAYPTVASWYNNFKKEQPDLWAISKPAMDELHHFYLNPPNLSAA
ncbi:Hypothetical predicted protein [Cloeon dipterum]|uniref:Glutathione transferase n=2 Tax=Cloeon dipterum TaxID=197152 RepID=A0A8S1CKD2_9INSE|nr:Hypothetical predicted protein [Cloeon dipterum]